MKARPVFERPQGAGFRLEGIVGERLAASITDWLLVAPDSTPAMLEMFRDRDRQPARELLPWSGEFAGKYLTSAVETLRLTADKRLKAYLKKFVRDLIEVQDGDGYLGPFPRAARLMGSGLWDIWGHYHCMLGLFLWHLETGDQSALEASLRAADHLCCAFLEGDRRVVQAGSEEMNESVIHILCLLYEYTGRERYLQLAREIEKDWEVPPSGDYIRCALEGKEFSECPKPRWESLHGIQGIAELYFITGDPKYRQAFTHIWWSIVKGDRHNNGAFSSGEQATGNPYDPRAIETCCTIAWMAMTVDMLRLTGDSLVADELELATFNTILGAQNATGRWWTYNTPMDGQRKASAHDIVFQARPGSPELNCCSVNGPRGLGMISEWAAMTAQDGLVLNYYGPSTFTVKLPSGHQVRIVQETEYPREGLVLLKIFPETARRFSLRLRIPGWSVKTRLVVEGKELPAPQPGRYLTLHREWTPGVEIDITFDFSLHFWVGEQECQGKASVYRGPILLAYDPRFDRFYPMVLPPLDAAKLRGTPVPWTRTPVPMVLLKLPTANRQEIVLCDFATAGATGTHYVSWLQVQDLQPQAFKRENPLRSVRPAL